MIKPPAPMMQELAGARDERRSGAVQGIAGVVRRHGSEASRIDRIAGLT
jgi:hypothetical protein